MRGLALTLAGSSLLALVAAKKPEPKKAPPAPPAVGRTEATVGGGLRVDAVFPGPIVGVVPEGAADHQSLLVLVRPAEAVDGPRTLYRLEPQAGGALTKLADGLPGSAKAMFLTDLDGDGRRELATGGMGELDSLGLVSELAAGKPARPLLRHPGFDPRSLSPELLRTAHGDGFWMGGPWMGAAEAGALRLYEAAGGELRQRVRIPLPLTVRREPSGLELRSSRVTAGPAGADGTLRFAVGPEQAGEFRLKTALFEVSPANQVAAVEAWSRLPGAEKVEESRYAWLGGRPYLLAFTQSSDKLALLEERKLRLFPLSADRTRSGKGAILTYETGAPRWNDLDIFVRDVDGDGLEDIALLYEKGLMSPELVLEVLPGTGVARFSIKARTASLDPVPERWLYGEDLTGDGLPDLVTMEGGELRLRPGAKGRLWEKKPRQSLPMPRLNGPGGEVTVSVGTSGSEVRQSPRELADRLFTTDLNGDGKGEVIIVSPEILGRGVVRVVWLSPTPSDPPRPTR